MMHHRLLAKQIPIQIEDAMAQYAVFIDMAMYILMYQKWASLDAFAKKLLGLSMRKLRSKIDFFNILSVRIGPIPLFLGSSLCNTYK